MPFPNWLQSLARPWDPDRVLALKRRWRELPDDARDERQVIGRYVVGCGATHGVYERCNFGCTACYLGTSANRQEAMPFERVMEQLVSLRGYLGPGGNVQITSGEVTLLPVEDLVRIVRAAGELGLSPMVMTHGDVLLHDPGYLERLVTEGGLQKLSIHVDTTQRGRIGFSRPESEAQLNRVRDRTAHLLRRTRARTGRKLKAAMTMTVNRENAGQLGDVVPWFLNHLDCYRILSLQPEAETGRTRGGNGVAADRVWSELEKALGMRLNPHPFHFGHRACNRFSLMVSLDLGKERILLQGIRPENRMDRRFILKIFDDFGGVLVNQKKPLEIAFKILGVLFHRPGWWWRLPNYLVVRAWQERAHWLKVAGAMLRFKLRVRPFAFVVHAFMSRDELETELGQQRLASCVFKLAVDGKMVSMCEMNATGIREATYV